MSEKTEGDTIGGTELVEIVTAGGHRIILNDDSGTIMLNSKDGLLIILDDLANKISIESFGSIELEATTNLQVQAGGNISISSTAQVDIKGEVVNIN